MEIGKPIKEADVPGVYKSREKYGDIYACAAKLGDGEVLPVSFEDKSAALLFCNSTRLQLRKYNLHASLRGNTVYISRRNHE